MLGCVPGFPFRICEDEQGRPVLTRGVIDLVFREKDGWVIVDYKTDDIKKNDINELAGHYKPQIKEYERAWLKCVEENVIEKGLFFTENKKYISL